MRLVFDEAAVLRENQEYLQRTLDLQSIAVHMTTDDAAQQHDLAEKLSAAEPGKPLVVWSGWIDINKRGLSQQLHFEGLSRPLLIRCMCMDGLLTPPPF